MVTLHSAVLAAALLSGSGETVLLDFYTDGCGPCRQMDPVVRELAGRGHPVRKVNASSSPDLAAKYRVDLVPCFVMLVDGQVVDRVVGGTTLTRLERMCQMAQAARPKETLTSQGGSPDRALPPGWRLPTPGSSGPANTLDRPADDLVAATVRLRIEDPDGHSCGSGTIIDAQDGWALILTCGHIFRDSKGQGPIEVDLFGPTPAERVPGHLLTYDLDRDIGLLKIRTPGPVTTTRVAPPGYRVAQGNRVVNVGCNNGDPPTARFSRVTSLDKYLGPPNLQVAGMPVQGRSGGGLFSEEGLVIGVCTAADPSENEGLYTALAAVHAELDRTELAFVYRSNGEGSAMDAPLVAIDPPDMPRQMPRPSDLVQVKEVSDAPSGSPSDRRFADPREPLSGEEQAALEEIRRRKSQGDEVICVIRSRSAPQASSEIIVLNNVSPGFLDQLAEETRSGPTADQGPPPRKTLLEYRSEDFGGFQASERLSRQPRSRQSQPPSFAGAR
ncbi:MAG: trypsin-like peptidase domain-containing protein [Planctomycetota bacterium]